MSSSVRPPPVDSARRRTSDAKLRRSATASSSRPASVSCCAVSIAAAASKRTIDVSTVGCGDAPDAAPPPAARTIDRGTVTLCAAPVVGSTYSMQTSPSRCSHRPSSAAASPHVHAAASPRSTTSSRLSSL
eukprot:350605-Chlamydomonas_euryale.AAC.4